MIKANELRIGNMIEKYFIDKPNEVVIVKALKLEGIVTDFHFEGKNNGSLYGNYEAVVKESIIKYEDAEPIQLSFEILLNIDFESIYQNPRLEMFLVNKQAYYPFYLTMARSGRFYFNENLEIKYVHQLQSLFFALTGEELLIKELETA